MTTQGISGHKGYSPPKNTAPNPSMWFDGKVFKWNKKQGRYEFWFTKNGVPCCEIYANGVVGPAPEQNDSDSSLSLSDSKNPSVKETAGTRSIRRALCDELDELSEAYANCAERSDETNDEDLREVAEEIKRRINDLVETGFQVLNRYSSSDRRERNQKRLREKLAKLSARAENLSREYIKTNELAEKKPVPEYKQLRTETMVELRKLFSEIAATRKALRANGSETFVTSSKDFLGRLELVRHYALGKGKAKQLNQESQRIADDISRIAKLTRRNERLEKYKKKLQDEWVLIASNPSSDEGWKRLRVVEKQLKEIKDKYLDPYQSLLNTLKARVKEVTEKRRGNNREGANAILMSLFPDRGGTEFFSEEDQDEIIEMHKHDFSRVENIVKEVFYFYNMIGRTYNLGGKNAEQPTIEVIDFKDDKKLGSYDADTNTIQISTKILDDPAQFRRTFTHEIGHWFEQKILTQERRDKNVQWLYREQKFRQEQKIDANGNDYFFVPTERQPSLCAREYSQKVYFKEANNVRFAVSDELISTGMEELLDDPEIFARRCPKHFDLVIENCMETLK